MTNTFTSFSYSYCRRMDTKTCKGCGMDKSLDEFHAHPQTRDRRQLRCKSCHNTKTAQRYLNLSPEAKAHRIATIKARKYGMTLEQMQALVEAHDDNCDLCGQPDTTHRKRTWTRQLTLDHDHTNGRFRGLLCSKCNIAIGSAGDDPALLRKMADYVEAFR